MRTNASHFELSDDGDSGRPSIFAYGVAFSALGAMAITARGLPLLGVYAVLILISGFVKRRLIGNTSLRWVLRVLLIGIVFVSTPDRDLMTGDSIGSTHARDLAGEIFASEMMLQFWRRRAADTATLDAYHPANLGDDILDGE